MRGDALEVAIGTVWFIWGEHQEVTSERVRDGVRQVMLVPKGQKQGKRPWVDAWRVVKYGQPSQAYGAAA